MKYGDSTGVNRSLQLDRCVARNQPHRARISRASEIFKILALNLLKTNANWITFS
jgi:hypothetical protein